MQYWAKSFVITNLHSNFRGEPIILYSLPLRRYTEPQYYSINEFR